MHDHNLWLADHPATGPDVVRDSPYPGQNLTWAFEEYYETDLIEEFWCVEARRE